MFELRDVREIPIKVQASELRRVLSSAISLKTKPSDQFAEKLESVGESLSTDSAVVNSNQSDMNKKNVWRHWRELVRGSTYKVLGDE